jgi:pantoate--beta-alanine ligase
VEILDSKNLNEIETIETEAIIALAVKFGKTRLIDNIFLR